MRILLTGARAPVTLDLARHFHRAGHEVHLADSVRWPVSRPTRAMRRTFHVARPALAPQRFVEDLLSIVRRQAIDLVVPTCEEIFFIAARLDEFDGVTRVFADPLPRLAPLHDKWQFARQVAELSAEAAAPETHLLGSRADLSAWQVGKLTEDWVLKPVFSRFAGRALIGPSADELAAVCPTAADRWIAQRRIRGQELSSYSVAQGGVLRAHACYRSSYRAGEGSGIYFLSHDEPRIERFARRLVSHLGYTGQIAFDFIVDGDGELYVLECNPRATSGVHLFDRQPLADAFLDEPGPLLVADGEEPRMLAAIMLMYALPVALKRGTAGALYRDMRRARDVLYAADDPLPALVAPLSLVEVAVRACRTWRRLTDASTFDIEWNGEPLTGGAAGRATPEPNQNGACAAQRSRVAIVEPKDFAGRADSPDPVERWLELLVSRPTERLIGNVNTRMAVLRLGEQSVPISINQDEPGNSYVCSAYTGCVLYPRTEIAHVDGPLLRAALRGLLRVVGPPLRRGRINAAVYVNNWLLSTNLYPELPLELIGEMTRLLAENFPDQAIGLRSLNRETNDALCRCLVEAGYLLAPSRQVYFFDGRTGDYLRKQNTRRDRQLLRTTGYRVVPHEELSPADASRIAELYRLLYIDKYSEHNPRFTGEMMEELRRRRLLRLWGLRSPTGSLDGVVGSFDRDGVMTVPLVGYDTALPQRLGLYRMLMALVLEEAAERRWLLNLSSGAAHFKRLRGGRPAMEYTAIYCRHLPRGRRIAWQTLVLLLERVAAPVLEKKQL